MLNARETKQETAEDFAGRARKKDLVVKVQEQRKKKNHQKGAAQEETRYFNFNAALAWMFGIGREFD